MTPKPLKKNTFIRHENSKRGELKFVLERKVKCEDGEVTANPRKPRKVFCM